VETKNIMPAIKTVSAGEALARVRSGHRVFVGSGAGEPQHLVAALADRAKAGLADAEVIHLLTLGIAPYGERSIPGLRHNALFIGGNVRTAVKRGLADYTPAHLSQIPGLFRGGRIHLDVALIQVAPPREGRASLGVAVDIVKAAVESADYVIAQINPKMPWTEGASTVPLSQIDVLVEHEEDLCELPAAPAKGAALWIGKYVAKLVEDGDTLQLGIGAIPDAVLAALRDKKDLGLHTEMFSSGVLPLIESGAITGAHKTVHPGKIISSFCIGTRELYDAVNHNPMFEFHPSDYVNDPAVIALNERMISVNSALQVDLTGQVAADSLNGQFYSGFGGQVDFVRGATASPGGRSIIALPSTAKGGEISRIAVALDPGTGVVTSRADVDFVVTEYGIASLRGKTIRERSIALIEIAHPKFRDQLAEEAVAAGLIDAGHVLPRGDIRYDATLERTVRLGKYEVFFRPLKPSDESKLKQLFYSQSAETTLARFGIPLKSLPAKQFQELVAIDYTNAMAVCGMIHDGKRERMIAVGRYYVDENRDADAALTVHDDVQGNGVGAYLLRYIAWLAKERGVKTFRAEVTTVRPDLARILELCFSRVTYKRGRDETICSAKLSNCRLADDPTRSLGAENLAI
jgi:acyl-CoA hydrolase/GNAT superfamily N-acetyltransferase